MRNFDPAMGLPSLLRNAYVLLNADWQRNAANWLEGGQKVLPAMITICNNTETAARVKYEFDKKALHGTFAEMADLPLYETDRILQIDSKMFDDAESQREAIQMSSDENLTKDQLAERLADGGHRWAE